MPSLPPQLCPLQGLGVPAKPSHLRYWGWEDWLSHLKSFPAAGSSASSHAGNCKGRAERGQGDVGVGFSQTTHLALLLSTQGDRSHQWGGKPGRAVPCNGSSRQLREARTEGRGGKHPQNYQGCWAEMGRAAPPCPLHCTEQVPGSHSSPPPGTVVLLSLARARGLWERPGPVPGSNFSFLK